MNAKKPKINWKKTTLIICLSIMFSSIGAGAELFEVNNQITNSENFQAGYNKRLEEGRIRLIGIQKAMEEEYEIFENALSKSDALEEKIYSTQTELKSLKNQLDNIESQLENTKGKINLIERQITKRTDDLTLLYEQLEIIEAETEIQKNVILKYFLIMQQENMIRGDDEIKNTLKFLLADASFSEYLKDQMYLSIWEQTERRIFHNLESAAAQFTENSKVVMLEKTKMEDLQQMLKEEKNNLAIQKKAKENLIAITHGKQLEYQALWTESQMQMAESKTQIQNLQANMATIKEKLQIIEIQKDAEIKRMQQLQNQNTNSPQEEYYEETTYEIGASFVETETNKIPLAWPIKPSGGITAYFRDESYKNRFGIAHDGIDIRCPQGTPIRAPDLGYVFEAADNGNGYSYIILAHKNNLITVYGHISKFLVNQGDTVQKGDLIGLSGGTPGTPGAGVMTTGPHLHFEVIDNGIHNNALDYLPINELPIEYIPEEFLKQDRF